MLIAVHNFADLFNCTQVDRASDRNDGPDFKDIHFSCLGPKTFRLLLGPSGRN